MRANAMRFVGGVAMVALLAVLAWSPLTAQPAVEPAATQDGRPPTHVRAVIEGTWRLVEWYSDGEILRSPDMEGLWMVYDGHVMATRHRTGPAGPNAFESTAGYGSYRWGAMTWTYGYERSEDLRGASAREAALSVTHELPDMRAYDLTFEGDFLVLRDVRGVGLRWDYDLVNNTFVLGPMDEDGELRQVLRKYRRVED
jgi:hypothetical protein